MNISISDGVSVSSRNGNVTINGEKIPLPRGMKTNSQSVINGKVYIGGYEFFPESKTFKRTLKALWHMIF